MDLVKSSFAGTNIDLQTKFALICTRFGVLFLPLIELRVGTLTLSDCFVFLAILSLNFRSSKFDSVRSTLIKYAIVLICLGLYFVLISFYSAANISESILNASKLLFSLGVLGVS